jgi:hypothetical protein
MKNLPIRKNYHEPKQTAVTAIALFYMRLPCGCINKRCKMGVPLELETVVAGQAGFVER